MGYGPMILQHYASRRLTDEPDFVIPLVRPEHRIIDCGCGPGSMTIDLAELAHRGEVVGVDVEPSQIAIANEAARERHVQNVRFDVATAYDLPFASESFDLAHICALLSNTRHPDRVLREVRRVTRSGGKVCVRAFDLAEGKLFTPGEPLIMKCEELHLRLRREYGQDAGVGRHIGELLKAAGLVDIVVKRSIHEATASDFPAVGKWMADYVLEAWGPKYKEHGWCTEDEVRDMAAAWSRLGDCDSPTLVHVWYSASATRP